MPSRWTHRHLLGIDELSAADIGVCLDASEEMLALSRAPLKKRDTLKGKTVVNLFFEASTRTRTSFELAGKRLSADVVNVSAAASSVTKGESLLDTVKNIEAMQTDVIVLRHPSSGAARFVAARTRTSIINAGDGAHEHPTQALLDALTIRRSKGRLEGLTVAICGDILHSRVARSNALLLGKLGTKVHLAAPRTMMPHDPEGLGATVVPFEHVEDAILGADVVMMLRIQTERLAGAMMATTREYSRFFGMNAKRMSLAKPDAIVMHPGPINRGVELDAATADGPSSVILDQVEAGVAVRAAVLELVLGARQSEKGAA
jgi:aspartate carbamoyltransferase catalytic subunit